MTSSDIFANQRQVWKDYTVFFAVARRSLPFIIGIVIGGFIFSSDPGYSTNLYTEILSIVATVGILDYLNDRRRKQEQIEDKQQQLIRDAGSSIADIATRAIEEIRSHGWLEGDNGILQGANLKRANLQSVILNKANLQNAKLTVANLQSASMDDVNLRGADLLSANLSEVAMSNVDLSGLRMNRCDLRGAILLKCDLSNIKLRYADLSGAKLILCHVDGIDWHEAILPDGTKWDFGTDMGRFTDESHPEYQATKVAVNLLRAKLGYKKFLL